MLSIAGKIAKWVKSGFLTIIHIYTKVSNFRKKQYTNP
ncbi:hypothetical protein THERMOS_2323 [Bathymodiolus thermophilus thioautotrophic gill symbiont]|uniref:Uncharacterized protein n=1 Tax=Bathymodiolus thermophilus thioautotrophic gill symbiont TaxID=2360 RepID=A0A8H8XF84_9GAMM|nr:hypothetical protein THERMOS_2323 [Bathymodiolus thermophilus thioautotrophic gill symbiont]